MTDKLLSSIYYNTKNNASFTGIQRLYLEAKKQKPNLTEKEVRDWLSGELTYTLHKPIRKNFIRNPIVVESVDLQWEADLADMKEFKAENDNYNYILTVIDCFSKYAFARPIKTKTGFNIIDAFNDIFKERKPSYLRTDKGTEFINSSFQKFLKTKEVHHFTSNDIKIKCAIVERFNRTLKGRMFKFFTSRGSRRYIDELQNFLYAYNHATHRTIKVRPIDVTIHNQAIIFQNIYKFKNIDELNNSKISNTNLKKGDKVRRAYYLKTFDRGYYPNYTDEIFTIEKTIKGENQVVFRIKDSNGNKIEQRFYPQELQKIRDNLYRVEKIIKSRTRKGVKEYFVKWLNYPSSYNSWISSQELRTINGSKN